MSINSEMKTCELYANEPIKSSLGQMEENFVFVAEIEMTISFTSMLKISDDIRYKDCSYYGFTKYKDFDTKKDYKVVFEDDKEYLIKSINNMSRLSQCVLQEVISNE